MDCQNQELDYVEPFFDMELYDSPVFVPEIGDVQSPGFDVDDYSVLSGTEGRSILPFKISREEESDMTYKRLKLGSPTQQCFYGSVPESYLEKKNSVPESSSPLGLTLRKTPSFLDLVESKLSRSNTSFSMLSRAKSDNDVVSVPQSNGKAKASNFSASLLRIGSWELRSRYDGQLVAKCYFAKRKLVWEVLYDGLKRKIEVQWSDISALKATCENNAPDTLEIELLRRPLFFRETNPQPRKHTLWNPTADFTGGQASIFRRHSLYFPRGTLQKHYEKLLQLDSRLFLLSKNPYPSLDSAYFDPDNLESQNSDDCKLSGLMGQNSIRFEELLESGGPNDEYLELLRCFSLSRTTIHPRHFSLQTVASSDKFVSTLGGSVCTLDYETSVSSKNISLPQSMSTFNKSNFGGSCYSVDKGEVRTDLWGNNLSASGQGKPNSNFRVDSALDFKPNCSVSEIETNENLADSFEFTDYKNCLDDYSSAFSYVGKVNDNLEEYGNCAELFGNISGTTPFPVFVVEDDDATSTWVGETMP